MSKNSWKVALVGTSGAGKSECLEALGLDPTISEMDRGLDTSTPQNMNSMLDWIRHCSAPVVAVSVHIQGLEEMARSKTSGECACFEDIVFVYLRVEKEELERRLLRQAKQRSTNNIKGTLQKYAYLDRTLCQIANLIIQTDGLYITEVANIVRRITEDKTALVGHKK